MITCWKTRRAGTLSMLFCVVLLLTFQFPWTISAEEKPLWQRLTNAILSGKVKAVEALIKKGADVNGKLESYTPLGI